jgi:hypothetical protein
MLLIKLLFAQEFIQRRDSFLDALLEKRLSAPDRAPRSRRRVRPWPPARLRPQHRPGRNCSSANTPRDAPGRGLPHRSLARPPARSSPHRRLSRMKRTSTLCVPATPIVSERSSRTARSKSDDGVMRVYALCASNQPVPWLGRCLGGHRRRGDDFEGETFASPPPRAGNDRGRALGGFWRPAR